MAMLNMTAAEEALKIFYLPLLRRQLNDSSPVLAVMERNTESVVGKEIRMALRYGRQGGVGTRKDDGDLPNANSRKTKQAAWETKDMYAHIQLTNKTIEASRSNAGAFASLLEKELQDATEDSKDALSRMVFGDGKGTLATFGVNSDANTLVVDNIQYLFEGQLIDIVDPIENRIVIENREIIEVDDTNSTITINGVAVNTQATDIAVLHGDYDSELTGFGAVFTKDNTLYGIDRSTNKWFNPTVVSLNGEISEVAIQQAIDDAERVAGGKTNFIVTSYGVRRAYQNLLTVTKQIVNTLKLDGGFSALDYNGQPLTHDKYATKNTMFGLDMNNWALYQMKDWEWMDRDGAVLSRVSNKAAYEATLVMYGDFGCDKPKGQWKMEGINEVSF